MAPQNPDNRIILTLDAGGTHFRFCALRNGRPISQILDLPSEANHLDRCLATIVDGFRQVIAKCPQPPAAISFAFPGPADYPNGIIGDLPNLPAFRGGVALGPLLEDEFSLPVFINNDGDLFAYGEAIAGLLPHVNNLLANAGNPKRFRNLIGLTIGTGFGGGIVLNGNLLLGDNSVAAEVGLLRNGLLPTAGAEETVSIRGLRQNYFRLSSVPLADVLEPKELARIAQGLSPGNQSAALEAFRLLGEVAGDALANITTLVDGLAVIGGGISGAATLFLPALVSEMNAHFKNSDGLELRRLIPHAFNLEDPMQLAQFLKGETCEILVPGSNRKVTYDSLPRTGVGLSRLGTSEAIALGAFHFALSRLGPL